MTQSQETMWHKRETIWHSGPVPPVSSFFYSQLHFFLLITFFRLGVDRWVFLCYILNMKMKLTANKIASRRTRNRIREHGPIFEDVTRELTGKNLFADRVCLRGEHNWMGWLPIDEIQATSPMGSSRIFWPVDEDGDFRSAGWCVSNLHAWQRECIDGKAHLDPMDACGHESKPFPQKV